MDELTATTDKTESSSTPDPTASAPVSAVDALKSAETRLSQADSSSANPNPQPPAATPPAGVVTPPAESEGLRNLRSQYEELKKRYEPYANWDVERARTAMRMMEDFSQDPYRFFLGLEKDLRAHPEFGKMMNPEKEEPEPQPDLQTADGQHRVYSAAQMAKWKEWNNSRLMKQVEGRFGPVENHIQRQQAAEQRRQVTEHARGVTERVMTELRQMPHFTEANEPKIAKRFQAIPPHIKREIGTIASLHLAYLQFMKEDVFPNLERAAEERVTKRMKEKAAAGTGGVRPGSGSGTGAKKRPSNPTELAEHMRQLEAAQSGG